MPPDPHGLYPQMKILDVTTDNDDDDDDDDDGSVLIT